MHMLVKSKPETIAETRPEAKSLGRDWTSVETLAVVAFAVVSLLFALIVPPFQFRDEDGHFMRAYGVSQGYWVGSLHPELPGPIVGFLRRFPEGIEGRQKLTFTQLRDAVGQNYAQEAPASYLAITGPGHEYFGWSTLGANLYSPVAYLPASLGIFLARAVHLPPAMMLYAARILNVLAVACALFAAFRLAPSYRALFAVIALMPMTAYQAGGISADAMTIALSLVGFALVLWSREHAATPRFVVATVAVFAAWALCKTSIWALPLVLLISGAAFRSRKNRWACISGIALAMGAALLVWQVLSHGNLEVFRTARLSYGIDLSANESFLRSHPVTFLGPVLREIRANWIDYLERFPGVFGWYAIALPRWLRFGYLALAAAVACTEYSRRKFDIRERIYLLGTFIIATFTIHALLLVSDGVLTQAAISFQEAVSGQRSFGAGVQARYFIPFCFAALLPLRQSIFTVSSRTWLIAVTGLAIILAPVTMHLILNRYYL